MRHGDGCWGAAIVFIGPTVRLKSALTPIPVRPEPVEGFNCLQKEEGFDKLSLNGFRGTDYRKEALNSHDALSVF